MASRIRRVMSGRSLIPSLQCFACCFKSRINMVIDEPSSSYIAAMLLKAGDMRLHVCELAVDLTQRRPQPGDLSL